MLVSRNYRNFLYRYYLVDVGVLWTLRTRFSLECGFFIIRFILDEVMKVRSTVRYQVH